ncbi:hypothetical protein PR202_ga06505 [Eleusine coracana subsp. coracana]|uniref:Leucine-rich repeat-containing N-terminal plant-type domain-containing protein n=1 Tax=Eleusine coracana subsp. coracana TaxID=191504 RepID=A0AAV5BWW8_ELECO|nr:hypothetical protein PR202_ga06505 [Eleusine coracana subsp. coracana]
MAFSGLALALLLLSLISRATPCTEQDKSSLLQFLAGLSRDGGLAVLWQNGTTDCCSWEGISCNGEGAVAEVVLAKKGLEGHVLPALGDLTGLLRLNLSHNSLSGGLPLDHLMSSSRIVVIDVSFNRLQGELLELPSSITHRWSLQVLNISSNMFTGRFPSRTWKSMKNLVALNASNNSFRGQVLASFCLASASFAMLDLSYNKFTGNIPPQLGNCSMITVLELGYNRLYGTIPDELFNATSLEHLSLRYASLHGTHDGAHVAKLSNLITLDLGENHFTGKIPDSIGQLKQLEQLHLDSNNMSGELPSALGSCSNLITIDLKSNYFSGELSKVNFSTLQNLERLDIKGNNFIGMVPESIYLCMKLTALRLADNKFYDLEELQESQSPFPRDEFHA